MEETEALVFEMGPVSRDVVGENAVQVTHAPVAQVVTGDDGDEEGVGKESLQWSMGPLFGDEVKTEEGQLFVDSVERDMVLQIAP